MLVSGGVSFIGTRAHCASFSSPKFEMGALEPDCTSHHHSGQVSTSSLRCQLSRLLCVFLMLVLIAVIPAAPDCSCMKDSPALRKTLRECCKVGK